jgi:hypothetical protein
MSQWQKWFAWYPVYIIDSFFWLKFIERRWNPDGGEIEFLTSYDPGFPSGDWEYRCIQDNRNDKMIERTDNEDDYEPSPVILTCICGDDFAKHEGELSEYLEQETDERQYFCSKGCEIEACLQYIENQDHKFRRF